MTPQNHSRGAPLGDDAIKSIAAEDRSRALGLVADKFRARLTYRAYSIVRDRQEAHDVVQEVLIKAMHEERFFNEGFNMQAWLYRVTTNLCYNIVRDKKRRSGILDRMPEEQVPQGRPARTHELLYLDQLRRELMQALEELTPNHREILLLRYFGDLSYAEIAKRLDIKMGTVMSRLSRARSRLGEVVGPDHPLAAEAC